MKRYELYTPKNMRAAIRTLRGALALFGDGRGWTRNAQARNARGEAVPAKSSTACKWCAIAVLWRAMPPRTAYPERVSIILRSAIEDAAGVIGIPSWNDHPRRHFLEVASAFVDAIFALERELAIRGAK